MKKTAYRWVGASKSKRKAIRFVNIPCSLKRKWKGHSKINEQINNSLYNWIMHPPQVMQSPIRNYCLKVKMNFYAEPQLIPKYLLQVCVFVFELKLVLGMWSWHKFYCWPIILSASVFGILIKCLPTKTITPFLITLTRPLPIGNQHTILIFIKVSHYLLLFLFYFCRSLNLIFNIFIFMLVVGFQPWTGWWFSWNDIAGLYILTIYLS